jgi:hypothetical protein
MNIKGHVTITDNLCSNKTITDTYFKPKACNNFLTLIVLVHPKMEMGNFTQVRALLDEINKNY